MPADRTSASIAKLGITVLRPWCSDMVVHESGLNPRKRVHPFCERANAAIELNISVKGDLISSEYRRNLICGTVGNGSGEEDAFAGACGDLPLLQDMGVQAHSTAREVEVRPVKLYFERREVHQLEMELKRSYWSEVYPGRLVAREEIQVYQASQPLGSEVPAASHSDYPGNPAKQRPEAFYSN
jgi:hypothetical protein